MFGAVFDLVDVGSAAVPKDAPIPGCEEAEEPDHEVHAGLDGPLGGERGFQPRRLHGDGRPCLLGWWGVAVALLAAPLVTDRWIVWLLLFCWMLACLKLVGIGEHCSNRLHLTLAVLGSLGLGALATDPAGVIVLEGEMHTDQGPISPGTLYYMSTGHDCFEFETRDTARLFLVGGEVFEEEILMYWNFVARTREEIVEATEQWNAAHSRFGEVRGYTRGRLAAPPVGPIRT